MNVLLEPVVTAMGYELVLLEYHPYGGSGVLRLFIDTANGVTLGDCERVSKEVAGLLDVEDPIPQNYQLEVSSPGLDRPLAKPQHFEQFSGKPVKLQMFTAGEGGRRKYQGVLRGMRGNAVVVETETGEVELALGDIERARLVPDYDELLTKRTNS